MGTCMAVCARHNRLPFEVEQRYLDYPVAAQIQQELKSTLPTTTPQSPNLPTSPAPSPASPNPLHSEDLVLQIEEEGDKTEKSKSALGNKSRFYHQKQQDESSLCEESCSSREKEDGGLQKSKKLVLAKSRRGSREPASTTRGPGPASSTQSVQMPAGNDKENSEGSLVSNYYSYSKDPTCLYSQKLPEPCAEGLTAQDDYIISLAEKYNQPTLIQQQVRLRDDSVYSGEWMQGMKHGKGTLTWDDNHYTGDWKFNKFWGKGTFTFKNRITFKGEMRDHVAEGLGELRLPDGSYYLGNWENNKQHGMGVHEWTKKERYEGSWHNGVKHGEGHLTFEDGSYYRGSFLHNEIHGYGEYHYHARMTYNGDWEHNEKCGEGQLLLANGERYEGSFARDKMHGQGKYYHPDGTIYEGTWNYGKREGPFTCTSPDGSTTRSEWYYGKMIRSLDDQHPRTLRTSNRASS